MDAANKRFGKRVVFIVPLHDAVMKLRRMVAAGTFPRVATLEELFWNYSAGSGDEHGNNQIYALGPLCAYAAIHGRSTAGMRPTFPAGGNFTGPHSKVPVDDEQIDVFAKIAWETVSTYPNAGVANKDGPDRCPSCLAPSGKNRAMGPCFHSLRFLPIFVWLLATQIDAAEPNTLSTEERRDGWRLLFDGTTAKGWRNFRRQGWPRAGGSKTAPSSAPPFPHGQPPSRWRAAGVRSGD